MPLHAELLNLLACPACKQAITLLDDDQGLACENCACVYPIQDEIPIMIIEKSIPRTAWDDGQRTHQKNS